MVVVIEGDDSAENSGLPKALPKSVRLGTAFVRHRTGLTCLSLPPGEDILLASFPFASNDVAFFIRLRGRDLMLACVRLSFRVKGTDRRMVHPTEG